MRRLAIGGSGIEMIGSPRMIETAVYDTKLYGQECLDRTAGAQRIAWRFHEFRLSAEMAHAALGAQVVCAFVNDQVDLCHAK